MEAQEIAANCRELNISLFPILLKRLHDLKEITENQQQTECETNFGVLKPETFDDLGVRPSLQDVLNEPPSSAAAGSSTEPKPSSAAQGGIRIKRKLSDGINSVSKRIRLENSFSNSSWAEMEPYVIGRHCMFPLSLVMRQRFILQYLAPTGEYQEVCTFLLTLPLPPSRLVLDHFLFSFFHSL